MAIEAEAISVHRLNRPVLRDVSLRIGDGECVSIIGPNGAGKSTLLSALLGLLPLRSGRVRLDGTPLEQLPRKEVARRVAYVPQMHDGYLGFRVRDVVESGRYAHLEPLESLRKEDHAAVEEAIASAGVAELAERTVETLSGGERQKVWIAAALAQQTPALLLDEPTNALDPAHQAELIGMMRSCLQTGRTLVVVCHDLNLPLALGGRVVGVRAGSILFDAGVETLFDTAQLKALFGADFTVHRAADGEASVHVRIPQAGRKPA